MNSSAHRILIIDDDAEFAEHLSALMPARFHVKTAYSLKQAMAQLTRYPFDTIVSDFVLAEHDGFEFLKSIRSLARPPKVVFMTAFASKEMAISLLNHGVKGLLEKPFKVATLTDLIEKTQDVQTSRSLQLDPALRRVTTTSGTIELTEVEFKIVSCMVSHSGHWVSREELINQVWGKSSISRNVLDTHLTNLKRKVPTLKEAITSVRGRGYFLKELAT